MGEQSLWHQEMVLIFRPGSHTTNPDWDMALNEIAAGLSATPFPRFRDYVLAGTIKGELVKEGVVNALVDDVRIGRADASERYLWVGAEIVIDPSLAAGPNALGYVWEIVRNSILLRLADSVGVVLLAALIASPGDFTVVHATAPTRAGPRPFPRLCISVPSECRSLAEKYSWPPLFTLPVQLVLGWLQRMPGTDLGLGTGPIGRAVAALSYSASVDHQNEAQLIWPLIGLESLYGRSKDGLQQQLLEKSEVLLGPRTAFIKRFKAIYAARSKFLHGTVDMPFAFSHASWQLDGFGEGVAESTYLAIAMLLSSLQHLVNENRHDLEFGYQRLTATEPPGPV
jgi:hypothetical protein